MDQSARFVTIGKQALFSVIEVPNENHTICDNSPEVWFDSRVAVFVPAMAGTQDVDRLKIQVKSALS